MNVFSNLAQNQPIAHALIVLAAVAVAGLALGSLRYRGIGLGTAGVLFAAILFGHFGEHIDNRIFEFVKEFGLVLFVFTIGMQLGPGFFAALREQGLKLNGLVAAIVGFGTLITAGGAWLLKIDFAAAIGLLSGAATNTPSLGAGQQTLVTLPNFPADRLILPVLSYAVAYPVGTACNFCALLLLRAIFRINAPHEAEQFQTEQTKGIEALEHATLIVENPQVNGRPIAQLPGLQESSVVFSRIRPAGTAEIRTPHKATTLQFGDTLLAVGTRDGLEKLAKVLGRIGETECMQAPGPLSYRRVVVTCKAVLGKSIGELGFDHLYGVATTRITRGDLEMAAAPSVRLRFGDVLQLSGTPEEIDRAATAVGNSLKALNETQFIPLFLGIGLGILVGVLPVPFPGMPVPVRLGLAGGPLIVAIILSRLGHIRGLVWHMPANANLAFRELGMTLFLACVGLKAGETFFKTVLTQTGLLWVVFTVCINLIPLLLVGAFARGALKLNFVPLSGLVAGSTTDPPALAFANALATSDAPSVAYATVYPLTMLLRILAAQALALILCK